MIPFNLPNDWLLVTRTVLPVIYNPSDSVSGSTSGLGDLSLTGWFVAPPSVTGLPPALTIGVGPTVQAPTHTDPALGFDKVGLGLSAVVVYTKDKWLFGGLASNTWSLGDGGDQFNDLLFESFVTYTLENDWYLISDITITADWNAPSSDRWTVPVDGGVSKTFNIGKQAVNASLQFYKNVSRPTDASDWTAQFSFQFLLPE